MLILFTGGSACGKSSFAEDVCVKLGKGGDMFYIAAMMPFGEGSEVKIARHRKMRATKGFVTIERYTDAGTLSMPERGTVLLECIANLSANEMFKDPQNPRDPFDDVIKGIENINLQSENLIVITNDVGSDGGGYDSLTMDYVEYVGKINAAAAARADVVIEMTAGIPLVVKGINKLPADVKKMIDDRTSKGENGMLLIIGAEGSGKRTYAESLGYEKNQMGDLAQIQDLIKETSPETLPGIVKGIIEEKGLKAVFHAEALARDRTKNDENIEKLADALSGLEVVMANEVGSGVIPAEASDRHAREAAGRLSVLLAKRAGTVIRMISGIPVLIKGDLP